MRVTIRLSPQEIEWLDEIVNNNEGIGFENRSEVFRLLLHREHHRRKNLPQPNGQWRSANRRTLDCVAVEGCKVTSEVKQ